jgi:hypothetical protein
MKNGILKALLFLLLGLLVPVLVIDGLYFLASGTFMFTYPLAWFVGFVLGVIGFFYGMVGYWGITRGLVFQFFGTLAGAFFVTLVRLIMGLTPVVDPAKFFFTEPAWWFGGLVGVLAFLVGVDVMSGWYQAALGEEVHEEHTDPPGGRKYFGVSLDHKVIGIQYLVTSLALLGIGGTFALIFRTELAKSQLQFLTTTFTAFDQNGLQMYNTLMSLHGIIMIVSILLGVAALMNYLVPMLIGAQDMSFPSNAFSIGSPCRRPCYWSRVCCSAVLTPAGRVIRPSRQRHRWACRCFSSVCSPRAGHPSWAR